MDIIDKIEATIAAAETPRCLCGCGRRLESDNGSLWYANEDCQRRFHERTADMPQWPQGVERPSQTGRHLPPPAISVEERWGHLYDAFPPDLERCRSLPAFADMRPLSIHDRMMQPRRGPYRTRWQRFLRWIGVRK